MKAVQLITYVISGLFILVLSSTVNADTKVVLQFGFEGGGDTLLETSASDISAGGGLYLGGGFSIEPQGSSVAYVGTIGYLFDSVDYDIPPGNAEIVTIPLEFTVRKKIGAHQVGGGVTYHLTPEYEECFDGFGCDNFEFDSAFGFTVLYSYTFSKMFLTGQYTLMDYDIFGISVDADSFGLYLGYKF